VLTLKKVAENHGLTKESVDYALSQYQIIISEITHGMLSKLSYDAHDVLAYAQDRWCETCELKQPDDLDRVRVVRCSDCRFWEPPTDIEADDGCTAGHCRNDYGACQNQKTEMDWFCADGEREG
jgi:hypothetical protein